MMQTVSTALVYFSELLISFWFFSQISDFKKKKAPSFFIGLALFGCAMLIYVLIPVFYVNLTVFFIINFVYALVCFGCNVKQAAFYSLILDLLSTITEFIGVFLISAITEKTVVSSSVDAAYYLLNCLICKTLYLLACLFIVHFINSKKATGKVPPAFYLYPVSVVAVLFLLWGIYSTYDLSGTYKILIALSSFVLLISIIVLFISYKNNSEKERRLFMLENQISKAENDKVYYDILEQQNEKLSIYAHDAKKHLAAIAGLTDNEEINNYISAMKTDLTAYSECSHSGNHALDIILNKYSAESKIKNIAFSYDARLSNLSAVEDYDLVTIVSNVLDNAFEAAMKSEEKKVEFSTDYRNTYNVIVVKNSCGEKPESRGGVLKTTKANKDLHGLGMKSVKNTLEKYKGDYQWSYDEKKKEFVTTIMILR